MVSHKIFDKKPFDSDFESFLFPQDSTQEILFLLDKKKQAPFKIKVHYNLYWRLEVCRSKENCKYCKTPEITNGEPVEYVFFNVLNLRDNSVRIWEINSKWVFYKLLEKEFQKIFNNNESFLNYKFKISRRNGNFFKLVNVEKIESEKLKLKFKRLYSLPSYFQYRFLWK